MFSNAYVNRHVTSLSRFTKFHRCETGRLYIERITRSISWTNQPSSRLQQFSRSTVAATMLRIIISFFTVLLLLCETISAASSKISRSSAPGSTSSRRYKSSFNVKSCMFTESVSDSEGSDHERRRNPNAPKAIPIILDGTRKKEPRVLLTKSSANPRLKGEKLPRTQPLHGETGDMAHRRAAYREGWLAKSGSVAGSLRSPFLARPLQVAYPTIV